MNVEGGGGVEQGGRECKLPKKKYVDEWLLSVSLRLCGWAGPVPAALLI